MLLKEKNGTFPKDMLKAIISLDGNPDFKEIMDYLVASKAVCAETSCLQADDGTAKRLAGGYMALAQIEKLVKSAEEELEKAKTKEKR